VNKKKDISKKYSGKKLQKIKNSFRKNGGYRVVIQSNKTIQELQNAL
jgi:hypothetical protein